MTHKKAPKRKPRIVPKPKYQPESVAFKASTYAECMARERAAAVTRWRWHAYVTPYGWAWWNFHIIPCLSLVAESEGIGDNGWAVTLRIEWLAYGAAVMVGRWAKVEL